MIISTARRAVSALLLLILSVSPAALGAARDPVRAEHGIVASVNGIASQVGIDVLKKGGNAVDAAVAVGFALAVTWPSAGNLGGGGFLLYRASDGEAEAIDYRERAPLAATADMYLDASGNAVEELSRHGYLAAGVPGTVAGLALAHARHGSLPWAELVEPARRLAAEGFIVDQHFAASLANKRTRERLASFRESRRIFLPDGEPWKAGERFVNPDLAATLARIRDEGGNEFYEGETARRIVAAMRANGGLITARDLATYEPTIREPLVASYRGATILTMPPPSSGGIALIQMLGMLEAHDLSSMGFGSAGALHLQIEAMKRAFADRAKHLGDADFAGVPVAGLLSPEYIRDMGRTIDLEAATPSRAIAAGEPARYESAETTHFTIVDAEGNVVSNTYSLNGLYGSAATVRGTGILLNNEMDDFTAKPGVPNLFGLIQGEANAIEPRKRPLSSMTPTIVLRDGELWFAVAQPGRTEDHQHRPPGDRQRGRFRHEHSAGRLRVTSPPPMAAGRDPVGAVRPQSRYAARSRGEGARVP